MKNKTEFQPCNAYPLCMHHKCDCYEGYLMTQSLNNIAEKTNKVAPNVKNGKDILKEIKKRERNKSI